MSGKDAQRRFVDLEVDEVSLVGSPANEVPFLVTKSKRKVEDPSMVAKAEKQTEDSQTVQVEQSSEASAEVVRKCLASVESIVKNVVSIQKGEAQEPAEEALDITKGVTVAQLLAKSGMDGDTLKSALSALNKAGVDITKTLSAPADTAKAETPKAQSSEELMDMFSSVIQKAARLTPARVKQLQDAQELLKLVLEGVSVGESPKTKTPDGQNPGSGIQTQLAKSAEPSEVVTKSLEAVTTGLAQITTVLKGLSDRIETIEKAKPPSSSDGVTTTDTKKAKTSLFAGVI